MASRLEQGEERADPQLARWVYLGTLCAIVGWLVVLLLPPSLMNQGNDRLAHLLYKGFAVACHQIPGRSYHLFGYPLAICSRCTGIYVGVLIGLLVYPWVRPLATRRSPARRWLLLAALPVGIDFGGDLIGLWINTFPSRTLTGGIAGIGAIFFLYPAIVEVVDDWRYPPALPPSSSASVLGCATDRGMATPDGQLIGRSPGLLKESVEVGHEVRPQSKECRDVE